MLFVNVVILVFLYPEDIGIKVEIDTFETGNYLGEIGEGDAFETRKLVLTIAHKVVDGIDGMTVQLLDQVKWEFLNLQPSAELPSHRIVHSYPTFLLLRFEIGAGLAS